MTETSERTAIEYGKSSRSTGHGEVFLTMVDVVDPLYVRWYSFGNGEDPLQVVDAHILSRQFTKATCRGENGLDETTNMCTLGTKHNYRQKMARGFDAKTTLLTESMEEFKSIIVNLVSFVVDCFVQ